MQSNPIWPVEARFPKLAKDITVDVAIVGGGIAGILSAYHLKNAGYKVAIIEQDEVGSGATGASSGVLYYGSGTNFVPAISLFGREKARFLWSETANAIKDIVRLVHDHGIDCGLRECGAIMVAKNEKEAQMLREEQSALKECGFEAKLLSGGEVKGTFTPRTFASGLEFGICAQIHPARFASGLARATDITIYENSKCVGWEDGKDGVTIKTPGGRVSCSKAVIATNIKPLFGLEKHFYTESSQIIASKMMPNLKSIWPADRIIWSMEDYYDLIYQEEGRCVLEVYRLNNKRSRLDYYYPNLDFEIEREWGSVWAKTKDFLPIVGHASGNMHVSIAMGDQGIVMGAVSGRNMVESIEGKNNMFLSMASPGRFQELK